MQVECGFTALEPGQPKNSILTGKWSLSKTKSGSPPATAAILKNLVVERIYHESTKQILK